MIEKSRPSSIPLSIPFLRLIAWKGTEIRNEDKD